jgi:hypothetical protein
MVTLAVPVFVSVTGRFVVVLIRMLPNATVVRLVVRTPTEGAAAAAEVAPVTPAQLERPATAARSARGAIRANKPRKLLLPRVLAAGATVAWFGCWA